MSDTKLDLANNGTIMSPAAARRWWLNIDKNDSVLQWTQTLYGQISIHLTFFVLLFATQSLRPKHLIFACIALFLCALFPARRMLVACFMGILFFFLRPFQFEAAYQHFDDIWSTSTTLPIQLGLSLTAFTFMALLALFLSAQKNKSLGAVTNRPVLSMFWLCFALTVITLWAPAHSIFSSIAWVVLACIGSTFFFIAYIFMDNRRKDALPVSHSVGFLRPFWAAGIVPVKGPGYLARVEAKDGEALARTRLKAVKLLVWALLLHWGWELIFNQGLFGALGLPRLEPTMIANATGESAIGITMSWLILAAYFLAETMKFAADLHIMIALVRMTGFAVPRGLVRPFASRTLAEFWGRYYFYFKEMLADIFFFPTFQRYFKNSYKLRIAFATIMAAFVGNILFDLIPRLPEMALYGFWPKFEPFYCYTIYAALLTAGLIVSQIRGHKPKPEDGWFRYNVLTRVNVIGFFMLLQIYDDSGGLVSVHDRTLYLLSMFGIS